MKRAAFLLLLFSISSYASFDHTHAKWGDVLSKWVTPSGKTTFVQYGKLKKNRKSLSAYLKLVSDVKLSEFAKFTRNEQLCFLINAYNAFTVNLIVEHFPVPSIRKIGGVFSNPWKLRNFELFGKKRTLDEIEHGMIRQDPSVFEKFQPETKKALKTFNENRVHFVLNCASVGCPALGSRPYLAKELEGQLEKAKKEFFFDSNKNQFDESRGELRLSSIFKWYLGDFEKNGVTLKKFALDALDIHRDKKAAEKIKIVFLPYNWNLNGN